VTLLQLACFLVALHTPLVPPKASGVTLGPPTILADAGGYTSCAFVEPGVADWKGPGLIASRTNQAEISEELWRIPLDPDEREPELIGYGRQPTTRGSLMAWVGTEPGAEGIWLRDLASDEPPQRVSESVDLSWPSIAEGDATIACEQPLRTRTGIQLLDVESGKGEWMITREERQPVYSPDGTTMLVAKHGQIWTLAGSVREEADEERVTDAGYEHVDASWGPRGEWIAFIGRWNESASNVGMLHLPTGRSVWVTEGMSAARSPVIAHNGRALAYIAAGDNDDNAIYVRRLKLRRPRG